MKKTILSTFIMAVALITANALTSCGGKDAASQAEDIISEAEKSVPEEASPCLGSIPSLQMQYAEAQKLLSEKMLQRTEEMKAKFKDGGSMEDAIRQSEIIADEKKAIRADVKRIYKERIMAEAKKLEGKSITCEADGKRFSKATARLVCSKDSSITSPLTFEAELTLNAPFRGPTGYCSWQYRDASGKELSAGATPVKDWKAYKAGDILKQSDPISVSKEKALSFSKIFFTE